MALQARAIVASKWLLDAVKDQRVGPKLRVLDTSWYLPKLRRNAKSEFKKRHIPGAAFFDIDQRCDKTSPLNGGLKTWANEGLPVSDRYSRTEQTEFRACLNRSWVKTYEDILDNLDSKEFQVVDARPGGIQRGGSRTQSQ